MKEYLDPKYLITSFRRFVEIIEEKHSATNLDPNSWIFRGHDNVSYKLIPSVGRLLGTERFPNISDVLFAERNALSQFEIKTYSDLKESNRFITLSVAQHHGLKTRLLDWTFSPLVALFFAVEDEKKSNEDGAVFAYNTQKPFTTILRRHEHPLDDLGAAYQFLSMPSLTPRINAQAGVFQLFNEPTKPFEDAQYLEKFIIPKASKHEIKIDLCNFGISYHTLFPDFDGIAKNLNFLLLNENSY